MLIIGIMSCQAHCETLQQAVRDTWLQNLPSSVQYLFMEGGHSGPERIEGDCVYLHCEDTYDDLAKKTYQFLHFALRNCEFDYLLKCDDDTYLHIPRLLKADFSPHDYIGNLPPGDNWKKGTYAQGGAYILSRKAVETIVSIPFEAGANKRWWYGKTLLGRGADRQWHAESSVEDMMVGDRLRDAGVSLHLDARFNPAMFPTPYQTMSGISCHHLTVRHMRLVHAWKMFVYVHPEYIAHVVSRLYNRCIRLCVMAVRFIKRR